MARVELPGAILILGGWLERSAPLLVSAELPSVTVSGTFSVTKLDDGNVSLKSLEGKADLSIVLNDPETVLWYWEPREFSSRPEYKEQYEEFLRTAPESAKFSATVGAKFLVRVTASGLPDLLVDVGKIVLIEWPEE